MSFPYAKSFYFYLEGVKTSFIGATVSISAGGFAMCSVSIPYVKEVKKIRTHTIGHILFLDRFNKMRLLFSGQLLSKDLEKNSESKTISLLFSSLSSNFAKTQIAIASNTPGLFDQIDAGQFPNENIIFMTGISVGAAPVPNTGTDSNSARFGIRNIPAVNNIIIDSFSKAFGANVSTGAAPNSLNYDYRKALQSAFQKYITPGFGEPNSTVSGAQNIAGSTSSYFSVANSRFKLIDGIYGFTSLSLSDAFFTKNPTYALQFLLETGFEMLGTDSVYSATSGILNRGFHSLVDVIAPPLLKDVKTQERLQPQIKESGDSKYTRKDALADIANGRAFNMFDEKIKQSSKDVKISPQTPGDTISGTHSSSSLHYKGLARDYGVNSGSDLSAIIPILYPLTQNGIIHEFYCNVRGHVNLFLDGMPLESHPKATTKVSSTGENFIDFIKRTHTDHLHVSTKNTSKFSKEFPEEAPSTAFQSDKEIPTKQENTSSSESIVIPSILFFPDLKSSDPPLCNVFMEENYIGYSANITGEKVTRIVSTQSIEGQTNGVIVALQPIEFANKSIDSAGVYKRNDFTSQEEFEVGVNPQIFSNRFSSLPQATPTSPKDIRNWYDTTNPIRFFEFRYAGQPSSVSMDFNPYPVVGLPGAIVDKESGHIRGRVVGIKHSISQSGGTTSVAMDCTISQGDDMEIKVPGIDLDSGFEDALKNSDIKKLDIFSPTGSTEKPDDVYSAILGTRSACGYTGKNTVEEALDSIADQVFENKMAVIQTNERPIPTVEDMRIYYKSKDEQIDIDFSGPDLLPLSSLFISSDEALGADTLVEKDGSPSTDASPKLKDRRKPAIALAAALQRIP